MNVIKNDLGKSQIELVVDLPYEELEAFIEKAATNVSMGVKIDGFRPGKVPLDVLKAKIGEMSILEEAANLSIRKNIDQIIKDNVEQEIVGQPQINITKLAPGNAMEYKITLVILPEIKLGKYKDLKIEIKKEKVSDKEVEKMLDDLREMRVKEAAVDRPARDKDKVLVDLEMSIDKVPLEGGKTQGLAIVIGKAEYIPGLDKKLIGIGKGEAREFSLPYPEDYHQANLAGKLVDFKVEAKAVYERILPELDDEFAQALGLKTAEELKTSIRSNIQSQKDRQAEEKAEIAMLDQAVADSRFGDIPELLVNHEMDIMMHELEHNIGQQGGRFEDYLAAIRKTREQLMLDMLPDAVKRVKASLLIKEVAKTEGIKVGEGEINRHIAEMIRHYKDNKEVEERLSMPEYRSYAANLIANRKVMLQLKEWNMPGEKKEKSAGEGADKEAQKEKNSNKQ